MARAYTQTRRADQQAQTRQRIVEAAVELHTSIGPAKTSLSMVAHHAGVQRNTLYAHFPDEKSLLMACSALAHERDAPPLAAEWPGAGGERLRAGLTAVYGWYGRNAQLLASVLRDAEHHPVVREISEIRYGQVISEWRAALGEGRSRAQQALVHLALSYPAWRALTPEAGLSPAEAVETMARAIEAV